MLLICLFVFCLGKSAENGFEIICVYERCGELKYIWNFLNKIQNNGRPSKELRGIPLVTSFEFDAILPHFKIEFYF